MNHYSDDDLVLVYYGEPDQPPDAGEHLRSCPECDARYQQLTQGTGRRRAAGSAGRH